MFRVCCSSDGVDDGVSVEAEEFEQSLQMRSWTN